MGSWYDIDPNDTDALYRNWQEQNALKPSAALAPVPVPAPTAPSSSEPAAGGLTDSQKSAKAIIAGALEQYGLGSLGDQLWANYLGGAPMEQVFLDLRQAPEYKARFAGMDALAKKGRAISESQYLDLERTYSQMFRTYGLPPAMYDSPDDFARLIGGEVAPTEIRDRLQMASTAALQAPQEVRDELSRLYGVDQGALTAFYLDPDKTLPVLTQQFQAGTLAATSKRTGYGNLSREEAERLAQLGITEDAASKGFGDLAASTELFSVLPGEGGEGITRTEQMGAAFEGNAAAIARINKKKAERKGQFEGGGGVATTAQGVVGLASAAS